MIKPVFIAIPLYYLSLFKAPISICKEITSLQRRFMWGWDVNEKKIAWIKWNTLCKPKKEGGLGIKDVKSFNKALIEKWMWKLKVDSLGMWREVLESKYETNARRNIPSHKMTHSWRWSDLCKICEVGQTESWFHNQLSWKVWMTKIFMDRVVWLAEENGDFSVKSAYRSPTLDDAVGEL